VDAGTTVRQAAAALPPAATALRVSEGGRRVGTLSRETLERALAHGIPGLGVAEVLDPPAPSRAAGAAPRSVARLLATGLAPPVFAWLRQAGETASRLGFDLHLVGGAVRDLLAAREVRDLDLVTAGDARVLGGRLARDAGSRFEWNPRFLTGRLRLGDGTAVDVGRARGERYLEPASLPRVVAADLATDLRRRDFTLNAIACNLAPGSLGALVDPTSGARDLAARRIRSLHGTSMLDDPTRAYRAVRLRAVHGCRLERCTEAAIESAVRRRIVDRLSPARLRREIALLMRDAPRGAAAREAARLGLWRAAQVPAPDATRVRELERLERLQERHPGRLPEDWSVALALLLRGARRDRRVRAAARLGAGRRDRATLVEAPAEAARIRARLRRSKVTRPSAVHRICRDGSAEAALLAAVASSPTMRRALLRYLLHDRRVRPDIDGAELLRAGVRPGPAVARGLQAALEAKLDGRAPDPAAQLAFARRAARRA
jgi:tRNA nucleotidyltransferase (CCA-adding enzyme)